MRCLTKALKFTILVASGAVFSPHAHAELPPGISPVEAGAAAPDFSGYALTDAEIAEKCKTAIKYKIDMTVTGDGRSVPRCVLVYEASRSASEGYSAAVSETQGNNRLSNHCESNQNNCIQTSQSNFENVARGQGAIETAATSSEATLAAVTP